MDASDDSECSTQHLPEEFGTLLSTIPSLYLSKLSHYSFVVIYNHRNFSISVCAIPSDFVPPLLLMIRLVWQLDDLVSHSHISPKILAPLDSYRFRSFVRISLFG